MQRINIFSLEITNNKLLIDLYSSFNIIFLSFSKPTKIIKNFLLYSYNRIGIILQGIHLSNFFLLP